MGKSGARWAEIDMERCLGLKRSIFFKKNGMGRQNSSKTKNDSK
jgi:hypothetical protein